MAIRWNDSADKHNVEREDVVHAMLNHLLYVPEFDEARREGGSRPDLYIGPQRDRTAPLLEVMVERQPPRDVWVFHAMIARQKFLALLDEED